MVGANSTWNYGCSLSSTLAGGEKKSYTHLILRIESPDRSLLGETFWMWQLYLFSTCHTDVSFKLPLEKSIKHVQVLKETIDLNWSKNKCQKMPSILQA